LPEGDTIFRAARALNSALAGRQVKRFDSVLPALTRVDADRPLAGRTIASVTARGKHLLIHFSGGLILRTHMRMNGSWHIYRPGERWQRPRGDMRVIVETDAFVAVGFNIPVAEFLTAQGLERHRELGALGPDLTAPAADAGEIKVRLLGRGGEAVADALLNQRVVAGLGNVLKSEVLFAAGVNPFTPVSRLTGSELDRVVSAARELMAMNVAEPSRALAAAGGRRTRRTMQPGSGLWVYGRRGLPCRKCGAAIAARKTGDDARITYWCPACQPPSPSSRA
jgi:endonuclease-8